MVWIKVRFRQELVKVRIMVTQQGWLCVCMRACVCTHLRVPNVISQKSESRGSAGNTDGQTEVRQRIHIFPLIWLSSSGAAAVPLFHQSTNCSTCIDQTGCGQTGGENKAGSLTCGNLLYLGFKSSLRCMEPVRPLIIPIPAAVVLLYVTISSANATVWSLSYTPPPSHTRGRGPRDLIRWLKADILNPLLGSEKCSSAAKKTDKITASARISTSLHLLWSEVKHALLWLGKHPSLRGAHD